MEFLLKKKLNSSMHKTLNKIYDTMYAIKKYQLFYNIDERLK